MITVVSSMYRCHFQLLAKVSKLDYKKLRNLGDLEKALAIGLEAATDLAKKQLHEAAFGREEVRFLWSTFVWNQFKMLVQ